MSDVSDFFAAAAAAVVAAAATATVAAAAADVAVAAAVVAVAANQTKLLPMENKSDKRAKLKTVDQQGKLRNQDASKGKQVQAGKLCYVSQC